MVTQRHKADNNAAELLDALGGAAAPRPLGFGFLALLVVVGITLVSSVVFVVGGIVRAPRRGFEGAAYPELMGQAVSAYGRADWDEAARLFQEIRLQAPKNKRTEYFLARIELTRRDAERLARAEEALVAGEVERARTLALGVASNSPLFAQAESFIRGAAQADRPKLAEGGARDPEGRLSADIRAALGEALALYEGGQFEEAALRAQGLADRATGSVQGDLLGWAVDAASFGPLYRDLSVDDQVLLQQFEALEQAIALDLRLSEGHYARGLKARAARAWAVHAEQLSQHGRLVDACAAFVRAVTLSSHERASAGLERRCENEAMRRVTQARATESRLPSAARALYEQVRLLSLPGNSAHRAAEAALKAMEAGPRKTRKAP